VPSRWPGKLLRSSLSPQVLLVAPAYCMLALTGLLGGPSRPPSTGRLSAAVSVPVAAPQQSSGARLKQQLQIRLLEQETSCRVGWSPIFRCSRQSWPC
jgi:hypothetical protein